MPQSLSKLILIPVLECSSLTIPPPCFLNVNFLGGKGD